MQHAQQHTQIDCRLCAFENPKVTVTALPIHNGKILVVQRSIEPWKGEWDFIGGYMQKGELPEEALQREIREELGVDASCTFLRPFVGTASYKDQHYPIISLAYLVKLTGDIVLDTAENSAIAWVPLTDLTTIAFDSNQKILQYLHDHFLFDIVRVQELVQQLDPNATVNEQSLYRAITEGYISTVEDGGKLVGMGWIFPRQTMLRRQAVIEDMIVDESQRGKGLGKKILLDLLRWAKKQGVEMVELTTNPRRTAANALYQKVGFTFHETNHYLLNLSTWEESV